MRYLTEEKVAESFKSFSSEFQGLIEDGMQDLCDSLMWIYPASILRKSTSGRHRPVSYPDGPMTAQYRFT